MRWRHITSGRSRPSSPQGPTGFHQRQRQGNRTASVAATVFYLVLCTSLSGYGRNTGTRGSLSQQLHSRQFEPRCKVFLDIPSEDEQNQQSDWWFQPPLKNMKRMSLSMCVGMGEPRLSVIVWQGGEYSTLPMNEVNVPFNILFKGSGRLDPVWRLKLKSHSIYCSEGVADLIPCED